MVPPGPSTRPAEPWNEAKDGDCFDRAAHEQGVHSEERREVPDTFTRAVSSVLQRELLARGKQRQPTRDGWQRAKMWELLCLRKCGVQLLRQAEPLLRVGQVQGHAHSTWTWSSGSLRFRFTIRFISFRARSIKEKRRARNLAL